MMLPVCRTPVSICCAKRRATSFTYVLEGNTSLSTISRVFVSIFFFGQSVVVNTEGVEFRPRAVVVWRGVVAGCTRILATNMSTKSNPRGMLQSRNARLFCAI